MHLTSESMAVSTIIQDSIAQGYTRLLAFDIEAYEANHGLLLELGVAIHELGSELPVQTVHYVFRENQYSRNGRYCADNRKNFAFGKTVVASTFDILSFLVNEISVPGTAVVGHNLKSDLRFLQKASVQAAEQSLIHQFLCSMKLSFDTQLLFKFMTESFKPSKLSAILDAYGVDHDYLHNAGNDAYYTLVAFLKLADLPFIIANTNRPASIISATDSDAGSESLSFGDGSS